MECQDEPDLSSSGSTSEWNGDYWYNTQIKYSCPHGQAFNGQDKRVLYGNCTFQSGDTQKIYWRYNSSRQLPNCIGENKLQMSQADTFPFLQRIALATFSRESLIVLQWFIPPTTMNLEQRQRSHAMMASFSQRLPRTRPPKYQRQQLRPRQQHQQPLQLQPPQQQRQQHLLLEIVVT